MDVQLRTSPIHDYESHRSTSPHFLLPVSFLTNSLFLHLYVPLLSHPINTNELLPLLPVSVSDLIITATNPFSWATVRAHCKTSSRVANTYNATVTH
ncbi:hypothetical protein HKD37_05G014385 [Glycine soja]